MIRLYPFSLREIKGSNPVVSSNLKLICVPIIGCVPTLDIFSANSNAPHKLEVSERPKQGILFSLQKSFKFYCV